MVKPLYKGKGRDPGSFRGITMASTVTKLFEYILLERIRPILHSSGHPLLNQSAYQKGLSCEEAVFATQEAIRVLLQDDGHAFLAMYDLEKAFDSVEVPTLFDCLHRAGVNGRGWRLLRSWYDNSCAQVNIDGTLSDFFMERGVCQGSVLSPIMFIIVMDDLLHTLESEGSGVSIQGLYAGGAIHADDIRTLSSSKYDVTSQAQIVSQFASDKGLKVNPTKSEVVAFSNNNSKPADDQVDICGKSVSLSSSGCCLGYHWSRDLYYPLSQWLTISLRQEMHSLRPAVLVYMRVC